MYRKLQFAVATAASLFLAGTAWAVPIAADLPYADYGHVPNEAGRCAAASMINSFGFLKNHYPAVYGDTFIDSGNIFSSDSPVVQLDTMMGGSGCGVSDKNAWAGKIEWVDTYAPGTTTFEAMTNADTTGWVRKDDVTAGIPTAAFLLDQLEKGEDVEIGLGGANHWVTLTGITTVSGDAVSIRYIDPNCPLGYDAAHPGPSSATVTTKADGMHFGWRNGDGSVCDPTSATTDSTIEVAFAESPIAEPVTILIFGTSLASLAMTRRRRRND